MKRATNPAPAEPVGIRNARGLDRAIRNSAPLAVGRSLRDVRREFRHEAMRIYVQLLFRH